MSGRYFSTKNTVCSVEYKRMRSDKLFYREPNYNKRRPHQQKSWKRFRKQQYKLNEREMKEWIIIEMEHCPKCSDGMVQAFCKPKDGWDGGEKLRCTQDKCDLKGVVVPHGKLFKCKYDLDKRETQ